MLTERKFGSNRASGSFCELSTRATASKAAAIRALTSVWASTRDMKASKCSGPMAYWKCSPVERPTEPWYFKEARAGKISAPILRNKIVLSFHLIFTELSDIISSLADDLTFRKTGQLSLQPRDVMKIRTLSFTFSLLVVLGGGIWFGWRWYSTPRFPEIPLSGADQALIEAIESAKQEVRQQPRSGGSWGKLAKVLAVNGYRE